MDFDGRLTYSNIASISCGHEIYSAPGVNIYPNPINSGNHFYLELTGIDAPEISIVVYDALGKEHFSEVIMIGDNDYFVTSLNPGDHLATGTYVVTGTAKNHIFRKKLVVK